jgi:Short C-terminal domain
MSKKITEMGKDMIIKCLASFIITALLFLTSCVSSYHVDQNLLNQNHLFKSTQAPSFTMEVSNDLKYLGQIDYNKNDSAHSYSYYNHNFINGRDEFIVSIQMITLDTGEWNVYRPWKWDLGKETHGDKPFYCGTSMFNLKLTKKEEEIYSAYEFFNGTKVTCKTWVYTPGGIMGGTRIIIHYAEKDNKINDMAAFIKRANERVVFKIGDKPFIAKEQISVADEILKLKKLKDQGVITPEEYNEQKIKLLDQ